MWLLPVFHIASGAALNVFYRLSRTGGDVPQTGPVLLVANHPNSLLDPALVSSAAGRPVRFLAKHTLFDHRLVGWMVRAFGSIPVYRRQDDPSQVERNAESLSAAFSELAAGSAVGIFPEGKSHSEPSLSQLKTGAARIALGAARVAGRDFPIIPVGLVFRDKKAFRSSAHTIVGSPVEWRDLADKGAEDQHAVRELTRRLEAGLRRVTVNLEDWEDEPLVGLVEAILAAEFDLADNPVARVRRLKEVSETLASLRAKGRDAEEPGATPLPAVVREWPAVADEVRQHGRVLSYAGLTPARLKSRAGAGTAIIWTLQRIPLLILALSGVWIAGAVIFLVPYRLTALLARRAPHEDTISTHKLLGGLVLFGLWSALLLTAVFLRFGTRAMIVAAIALPVLGLLSLLVQERLGNAWRDVRVFMLQRGMRAKLDALREQQAQLARKISAIRRSLL